MTNQVNKLASVDRKLGAPTGGQQTTRALWHSSVGGSQQINFFRDFQGLSNGQTNLDTNKLDASESMVIKNIAFYDFSSFEHYNFGADGPPGAVVPSQYVSIIIGGQKVVKKLPLHFNANGVPFDRLHALGGGTLTNFEMNALVGQGIQLALPLSIRLVTDIVIPPQVSFEVVVEKATSYSATHTYVCALQGYGQIYSASGSF